MIIYFCVYTCVCNGERENLCSNLINLLTGYSRVLVKDTDEAALCAFTCVDASVWTLKHNQQLYENSVCVYVCVRVNFNHLSPGVSLSNPPYYFAIHSIIQNRIPTDQYFVYTERCIIKLSNRLLMLWQYFWHFSEVSAFFHTDTTLWVNQADWEMYSSITWHC